MRRVIALALAWASTAGFVSAVGISAAGPTTRTVYVTVVDDEGRAVPGLTPADFVVKEGGKEREIASLAPASEKMRLATSDRISVPLKKPGATLRAPSRVPK